MRSEEREGEKGAGNTMGGREEGGGGRAPRGRPVDRRGGIGGGTQGETGLTVKRPPSLPSCPLSLSFLRLCRTRRRLCVSFDFETSRIFLVGHNRDCRGERKGARVNGRGRFPALLPAISCHIDSSKSATAAQHAKVVQSPENKSSHPDPLFCSSLPLDIPQQTWRRPTPCRLMPNELLAIQQTRQLRESPNQGKIRVRENLRPLNHISPRPKLTGDVDKTDGRERRQPWEVRSSGKGDRGALGRAGSGQGRGERHAQHRNQDTRGGGDDAGS